MNLLLPLCRCLFLLAFAAALNAQTPEEKMALAAMAKQVPDLGWSGDPSPSWRGLTVEGDKLTRLDLSNVSMPGGLPAAIGQLSNLQMLQASNCGLSVLPPELGQLKQLRILDINNNKLSALPAELMSLSNLRLLRLQNNQLTTLPETIGQLTQLNTLQADNNQLSQLPDALLRLTKVEVLYLHNNVLEQLPAGFTAAFPLLQDCTLQHNYLSPAAVAELKKKGIAVLAEPQKVKPEPAGASSGK